MCLMFLVSATSINAVAAEHLEVTFCFVSLCWDITVLLWDLVEGDGPVVSCYTRVGRVPRDKL